MADVAHWFQPEFALAIARVSEANDDPDKHFGGSGGHHLRRVLPFGTDFGFPCVFITIAVRHGALCTGGPCADKRASTNGNVGSSAGGGYHGNPRSPRFVTSRCATIWHA